MEIFILKLILLVVSTLVVTFFSVVGVSTYYGFRIYYLVKRERERDKRKVRRKKPPR